MESNTQVLCVVKLAPSRDCFVSLPRRYLSSIPRRVGDVSIVRICRASDPDVQLFCSVSPSISPEARNGQMEDVVTMSPSLGIRDQEPVLITKPREQSLGVGVKVFITPASEADWQILQLNQSRLENSILGQVRVVQRDQRLHITLDKMAVCVIIRRTDPEREAVILQRMTEFVIIDGDENETREKTEMSQCFTNKSKPKEGQESFSSVFKAQKFSKKQAHPYICYISENEIVTDSICVAKMVLLPISFQASKKSDEKFITVQIKHDENVAPGVILIHDTLMRLRGINLGSRIFLRIQKVQTQSVQNDVTLMTTQTISEEDKREFDELIGAEKKCFFPSPGLLELKGNVVLVQSEKSDCDFVFIDSSNYSLKTKKVETLPIEFKTDTVISSNHDFEESFTVQREPTYQLAKLEQCKKYLMKMSHSKRHANLLVTGNSGIGKTWFVKSLASMFTEGTLQWTVRIINCVTLRRKRPEAVTNQIRSCLEELDHLSPGILILDNLDSVAGAEEEDRPDDTSACLSSWLVSILQHPERFLKVSIIVTAKSPFSLNNYFQSTRGSIPFRKLVSLTAPTKDEIEALLQFYTNHFSLKLSSEILTSLEGFYPSDLRRLVDTVLTTHDEWSAHTFEQELKHYVPASKWGEDLKPKCLKKIEDVGGLHEARRSLIQVLLWPSQYPGLFREAGVRTPRGVLLYGAPGTGKTLVAEAVSSHTGLNMIVVRGPEILSKYIGASEANVRSLFERAQAARPCIIFFDEFESLAPHRGHDTTGVTDRVVNQLLTQLDGVEGLDGVWVIAASSRPDLIDPALLRPGRLDRSVHCPMPAVKDRSEILEVLLRGLDLEGDVDLEKIAKDCHGMTGADLRGLVYTASLLSRQRCSQAAVRVTQDDILQAVASTNPSVTSDEVDKYNNIYSRFQNGTPISTEQRATLA